MYKDPPVLIIYYPTTPVVHSKKLKGVLPVELLIALDYVNEVYFEK
jgi:hypothetical protein